MKVPFCLALLLVGTTYTNAWAQHGRATPHPAGGGGVHPGAIRPGGGMTPQQHQQMQQQQMQQQRMLYEIMGWNTPSRGTARGNGGGGHVQARPKSSQPGGAHNNAAKSHQQNGNPTPQSNQTNASSKQKASANNQAHETKKTQNHKELEHRREAARKAQTNTRLPLAADQGAIGHLRTAHNKLREADHDYAGHRVRAMEHVSAAIRSLHPTLDQGSFGGFGIGNMPQSQSDQILRDAMVKLQIAQSSLPSGTNRAAHHESAHRSVTEAIRELHLALNTR
jgi:hypothetical protein